MKNLLYLTLVIILSVTSCGPRFVAHSDYDRSINLRNYQTFKISDIYGKKPEVDPILNNDFNRKRISTSIASQLTGRGYIAADSNPDLEIRFFTKVKDKQETQYSGNNFGWWSPGRNTYTRNYEESTLIIDILDAKDKKLVWQGWASGEKEYSSKNVEQKIWDKVNEIFRSYPVKPGKPIPNNDLSLNK